MSETKVCIKCNIEQSIDDFSMNGKSRRNVCKQCVKTRKQQWFQDNKDDIWEREKEKMAADPDLAAERKEYSKDYQVSHRDQINTYRQERKQNNPALIEQEQEYQKIYRATHKEEISSYNEQYREAHKEEIDKHNKEYWDNHPEERRAINKRHYNKVKDDPQHKLESALASVLHQTIKDANHIFGVKYIELLPFDVDNELIPHLQSLFNHPDNLIDGKPWMTLENHGKYNAQTWDDNDPNTWKWNVDHIIPKSSFIYSSPEDEDFKKCWSLENLRPYSAKQNILDKDRGSSKNRKKR